MSIHVTCAAAGGYSERGNILPVERAALLWSETLSSPGTTSKTVPATTRFTDASSILTIHAINTPKWIAIGPGTPSASDPDHRRYLPAGGPPIQVAAEPGDRVAYLEVS